MQRLPLSLLLILLCSTASADELPEFHFNMDQNASLLSDEDSLSPDTLQLSDNNFSSAFSSAFSSGLTSAELNRERRAAMREHLLDSIGLSQYLPRGHFNTFGHDTRWGLSVHEDLSVTLRLRMKW
ncbi:MAG: hypothetical protein REI12_05515 [Pedobacter sp.]|nr:hypothetical protein [Pedobacter sp.]